VVDGGAALLTQGPGQVLWRARGRARPAIAPTGQSFPIPVRFGEYQVLRPPLRCGSGSALAPRRSADESWLPWTEWLPGSGGAVPLPAARSLQWELELAPGSTVERVEWRWRDVNLAPRIDDLSVDEPGGGLPVVAAAVRAGDRPRPPGLQRHLHRHRPRGGAAKNGSKGKKYYRTGYRTVSWEAKDLNEDALVFRLEVRARGRLPDDRPRRSSPVDLLGGRHHGAAGRRLPLSASRERRAHQPWGRMTATRSSAWFVGRQHAAAGDADRQGERWAVVVEGRRQCR